MKLRPGWDVVITDHAKQRMMERFGDHSVRRIYETIEHGTSVWRQEGMAHHVTYKGVTLIVKEQDQRYVVATVLTPSMRLERRRFQSGKFFGISRSRQRQFRKERDEGFDVI